MHRVHKLILTLAVLFSTQRLPGQSGEMRQVAIVDPVLQMTAWTAEVPSDWKAEGTMLPGSSCESGTTPIIRASSPGPYGVLCPARVDWAWGAMRPQSDCPPPENVSSPETI